MKKTISQLVDEELARRAVIQSEEVRWMAGRDKREARARQAALQMLPFQIDMYSYLEVAERTSFPKDMYLTYDVFIHVNPGAECHEPMYLQTVLSRMQHSNLPEEHLWAWRKLGDITQAVNSGLLWQPVRGNRRGPITINPAEAILWLTGGNSLEEPLPSASPVNILYSIEVA